MVGASLAGLRAAETARKQGASVTLVGAEPHLPYDRPPLSKAFLSAGDEPTVPHHRTASELEGIALLLGEPAWSLDVAGREVQVGDAVLGYDQLIVATGAQARTLPGERLPGVLELRTLDDARALRAGLDAGGRVVVIGGGFIGAEVASAARRRGLDVTIVETADLPWVRAVGEEMARVCVNLHGRHGTVLRTGVGVRSLDGDGRVAHVVLEDGSTLPADLVVVGIGAEPATGWLEGSGLRLDDGVVCDAFLNAADRVWAAGDAARWENPLFGLSMRLEHWTSAAEQGARAARNALDPTHAVPYETVPYFWSDLYDDKLQMVGVTQADEVRMVGSPDDRTWVALYRRGHVLGGALTLNLPGRIMKYRAMVARRAPFAEALALAGA